MRTASEIPPASTATTSPAEWLRQGHELESCGRFDAATDAYDRAIGSAHVQPHSLESLRTLGVCWMNRGNALQQMATADAANAAVSAYDEAIRIFAVLPNDNPRIRNHLGAALLNRGHALLATGALASARAGFADAIAVLRELPLAGDVSYRINLAGAWTNYAHVLLSSDAATASAAARHALELLAGYELSRPELLEMSLRARRALVTALGQELMRTEHAGEATAQLANEAVDVVEEGLALVQRLPASTAVHFRALALRLFRLGTQLYRLHQPHFLADFILETLEHACFASDAEFHSVATETITSALADLGTPRIVVAGTRDAERLLVAATTLRAAQARLTSTHFKVTTNA